MFLERTISPEFAFALLNKFQNGLCNLNPVKYIQYRHGCVRCIAERYRAGRRAHSQGSTDVSADMLAELETSLEAMDLGPLLGLWLQSALIGFTMKAMGFIIFVLVYCRMLEIYLLTSLAPHPRCYAFQPGDWRHRAELLIKSLFAVGFQGLLILVCVANYAVLIQGIATGGDPIGAIWGTVGYTVLLCFMLFKTGSIAQRIFGAH